LRRRQVCVRAPQRHPIPLVAFLLNS